MNVYRRGLYGRAHNTKAPDLSKNRRNDANQCTTRRPNLWRREVCATEEQESRSAVSYQRETNVKRLLNAEELAERLGLKVSTVYALTSGRTLNADIPPWFYVGRYPRWSEDDIEQWLAEKERHYAANKMTNSEGGTRHTP